MRFTQEEMVLEPAAREQADEAALLMWDTDPHLFGHFFTGDRELAVRYFAAQWRQERSLFSYRHCTVAVARGAFLGIELGYDAKTQADVMRDTGRHAAQILTPDCRPRRRCASTGGLAWRSCRRVASYPCKSTASPATTAWSRASSPSGSLLIVV
jgi:hypothetical protein